MPLPGAQPMLVVQVVSGDFSLMSVSDHRRALASPIRTVAATVIGHHPVRPECACEQATPVLPVGTCIGADQHAPEGASLMMVLFTSFTVPRQCRARMRSGDTPWLDGCRFSDSIEEEPTVKAAARCLVRLRLVATEPQWPRINSAVVRSLRTRHSHVIPKIGRQKLRFGRFWPSSLPRFAASDDGHFASGELPARP